MIAISYNDFLKYGCANCGCDEAYAGHIHGGGTTPVTCRECRTEFVILGDGITKSRIGFGSVKDGQEVTEYPELQEHPRKGIPWHPWVQPDPRPEGGGEYWKSRGIGYDLSGFVKSKAAGERLREMVKEVLNKETPESWLDWREHEPTWIQFKFQKTEFDLDKLDKLSEENNHVLTKEILLECKL